ncbi:MAG: DUF3108 domain-containing protein [Zoogloeaceae bacterium]|jgi:hypothetical protein|nr:DUF3108 domain-containing protein [Zoogloeaceae bacterium]
MPRFSLARPLSRLRSRLPVTFLLALLLSVLLHFLTFGGLEAFIQNWRQADEVPRTPSLQARLAPRPVVRRPPPPRPPSPAIPQPQPQSQPAPSEESQEKTPGDTPPIMEEAEEASNGLAENEVDVSTGTEVVADAETDGWPDPPPFLPIPILVEAGSPRPSPSEPLELELADGSILPWQGEIEYRVYRGDTGIGKGLFTWEFRADQYRLFSRLETTGLVSLFRPIRMDTESLGVILDDGFYPVRYRQLRNGQANRAADFDWAERQLRMGLEDSPEKQSVQPLRLESQDVLSLQAQIMLWPVQGPEEPEEPQEPEENEDAPREAEIWIATGEHYEAFRLVMLGEETLNVPAGTYATLHLQIDGRTTTDFWLARDFHMLPVQIRFRDKKDDVYEERMTRFQLAAPSNSRKPSTESSTKPQP